MRYIYRLLDGFELISVVLGIIVFIYILFHISEIITVLDKFLEGLGG